MCGPSRGLAAVLLVDHYSLTALLTKTVLGYNAVSSSKQSGLEYFVGVDVDPRISSVYKKYV